MEAMHKLADREIKAGRMLDNGGLMPVAMGAQVRITDGQLSVLDGPFRGGQGGHRRLRDLRAARQGGGLSIGEGVHAVAQGSLSGWEGVCELRAFASAGLDARVRQTRSAAMP